jgi:hypothetical protein
LRDRGDRHAGWPVQNLVGIFVFNTAEGWSRDVSADIAAELRRRCDLQLRDVPSELQDLSIDMMQSIVRNSCCRCAWPGHEMHPLPILDRLCETHPPPALGRFARLRLRRRRHSLPGLHLADDGAAPASSIKTGQEIERLEAQ